MAGDGRRDGKSSDGQGRCWAKSNGPGKNGSKRHVLVDGRSVPLSIVVTGANKHDSTHVDSVLFRKVKHPDKSIEENRCTDAGYTGKDIKESMEDFGYTQHIKSRKAEADAKQAEGFKGLPLLDEQFQEIACALREIRQ